MRLHTLNIVCSILLLHISQSKAQTGVFVPQLATYDTGMLAILNKYNLVGGQLAITYQGRLVYNRGFGYADSSTKQLVQPESIFRLASVSKALTSVAIMHLVEQGKLTLDAKVFGSNAILKDTMYTNVTDPRFFNITVRQLLNHSAGFKYVFPNDPIFKTYDIAQDLGVSTPIDSVPLLVKWALKNTLLDYNPGSSASYTNFGYVILGQIIEKISGKKYETYVKDSILKPMGIASMHAGKSLLKDKLTNEVTYYDYGGAPLSPSMITGIPNSVPAQYGFYNYEVMTPAGGWVASAEELCRLLVSIDKFSSKPDFLQTATIDTMTKSSVQWPAYALGWFVGGNDYWHTGGIQGTASVIQRNASKQLNWAVHFNTLPQNYGPLYTEFMNLVLSKEPTIKTWPAHDLFQKNLQNSNYTLKNKIHIYPNPTEENITIESSFEIVEVLLCNPIGNVLFRSTDIPLGNQLTLTLNACPKGVYYVSIKTRNATHTQAIIME